MLSKSNRYGVTNSSWVPWKRSFCHNYERDFHGWPMHFRWNATYSACLVLPVCTVAKRCKTGIQCVLKYNRNVGSTFRLVQFSTPIPRWSNRGVIVWHLNYGQTVVDRAKRWRDSAVVSVFGSWSGGRSIQGSNPSRRFLFIAQYPWARYSHQMA